MNVSLQCATLSQVQEADVRTLEEELGCRIIALEERNRAANLTMQQLSLLQLVEKALGVSLVAYESAYSAREVKPSPQQLERLSELEREMGFVLVAYALPRAELDVEGFHPGQGYQEATLSKEHMQKLRAAEHDLGLVLMAYKPPAK